MIIDHSSAPLIGCCKQPVKYAGLSILVICEDAITFFNIWIVRDYSFTQLLSSCPVLSFFLFFFFFFFLFCSSTPLKKKCPLYTSSNFPNSPRLNYLGSDQINLLKGFFKIFFIIFTQPLRSGRM